MSIEEMWQIAFMAIAVLTSGFWLPLLLFVVLAIVFFVAVFGWAFIMIAYDNMKLLVKRLMNRK